MKKLLRNPIGAVSPARAAMMPSESYGKIAQGYGNADSQSKDDGVSVHFPGHDIRRLPKWKPPYKSDILLMVYGSLLDGQTALVVLNVLFEAFDVSCCRSHRGAAVACEDHLLEIVLE